MSEKIMRDDMAMNKLTKSNIELPCIRQTTSDRPNRQVIQKI